MTKNLQARLEKEEYDAFKRKFEGAGFDSLQAAMTHLVQVAIAEWGEPQLGKIPPKLRPYMRKFEALLASGDSTIIDAVTSNVDVFSELHELKRKSSGRGPDTSGQR